VYLVFAIFPFAWSASLRADLEAQAFDIKTGDAIENIKLAAYQADVELLFALDLPPNVQTRSVKGDVPNLVKTRGGIVIG